MLRYGWSNCSRLFIAFFDFVGHMRGGDWGGGGVLVGDWCGVFPGGGWGGGW